MYKGYQIRLQDDCKRVCLLSDETFVSELTQLVISGKLNTTQRAVKNPLTFVFRLDVKEIDMERKFVDSTHKSNHVARNKPKTFQTWLQRPKSLTRCKILDL